MKKYKNTIEFEVYGNYALFADPVTRVGGEKTSYHIPTYEALKGIVESVYWKPTIMWIVDAVRIMNPIQTETKGIRPINYSGGNDPELADDWNENKHHNIAKRMVQRGGRRDVFLGTRECQAFVEPCVFGEGSGYYDNMVGEIAYGFMYHGITYADEAILPEEKGKMTVNFWNPVMTAGGIIEFIRPEKCTQKRFIKEMEVRKFGKNQFSGLKEFDKKELEEVEN